MTHEEHREGFYKDRYGRWQKDRRSGTDRRRLAGEALPLEHERRKMYRRRMDREIYEKDHRAMIDEALDDFAQEHGGHV